jgi:DNA-binding transcriptional regulator YdaS (Cro superfamily)
LLVAQHSNMNTLSEALDRIGMKQATLATAVGVHRSQVTRWVKWNMPVPAERVPDVERVTGIPRHELRPDIYEAPTAPRAGAHTHARAE